jgi:uncharacterized protein (DUF697 family)
MLERIKQWFSTSGRHEELEHKLDQLRQHVPVPVFWLFGKTQSGKTSVIKYLTGAEQAEIGKGFQPCTRFSRQYDFPTPEAPLLTFLDTRGLDEPGYDATEDLERFGDSTHVMIVTVKALDHAQENVLTSLRQLRRAQPLRPVVLVLTCLHEAYPQQQHPVPYPLDDLDNPTPATPPVPEDLLRSLREQRRRFEGLVDRVVAVDLTPAEEGFAEPNYGGDRLKQALLDVLPAALGQTLRTLDVAVQSLKELYARQALPYILSYSTMAATAGAVPIPVVDVFLISGIQTRMIYHLAELYGQPMTGRRFAELASSMGLGILMRQAGRGMLKLIPFLGTVLGSVASGALAGASTYALGKAFCYYYQAVHEGHVPSAEDLRRYYREELATAEQAWQRIAPGRNKPAEKATGGPQP